VGGEDPLPGLVLQVAEKPFWGGVGLVDHPRSPRHQELGEEGLQGGLLLQGRRPEEVLQEVVQIGPGLGELGLQALRLGQKEALGEAPPEGGHLRLGPLAQVQVGQNGLLQPGGKLRGQGALPREPELALPLGKGEAVPLGLLRQGL